MTTILATTIFLWTICRSNGKLMTLEDVKTTPSSVFETKVEEAAYVEHELVSPQYPYPPTNQTLAIGVTSSNSTQSSNLIAGPLEQERENEFFDSPGNPSEISITDPRTNDSLYTTTQPPLPKSMSEPNFVTVALSTISYAIVPQVGAPVVIKYFLQPQPDIQQIPTVHLSLSDTAEEPQPATPTVPADQLIIRMIPYDPTDGRMEDTAGLPIFAPSYQYTGISFDNKTAKLFANSTGMEIFILCGYPPYNDRVACRKQNYFYDLLFECENEWEKIIFGILVGIGGAAIISMNGLILVVITCNSDMRSHYDLIKVSLALADGILGVLVFATVFPNMVRISDLTEAEVVNFALDEVNSLVAITAGSFLTVTMQASLLHLCFLSIERFMAIKWSFWHMRRKRRSIVIALVAIWIMSIVSAFMPAFFPGEFEYKFQPALLIHMLTTKPKPGTNEVGYAGILYTVITLLLPYIVMVMVCILTGVVSYQKLRSAARVLGKHHTSTSCFHSVGTAKTENSHPSTIRQTKKRNLQPEIAVFITIVIMICAFTFTLLPFAAVVSLFTNKALTCDNYTIPYATAFYFGLLNSLANGIIYSARDLRFRLAMKELFCKGTLNHSNSKSFSSNVTRTSRA